MPEHETVIKKGERMRLAAIRDVVESYGSIGALLREVFAALGEHRITPIGPGFAIYYDEVYQERDVDVEAAVPVGDADLPDVSRLTIRD